VAVTSANPAFGSDSGLADRLLVIRMKRRESETAESAISDELRVNRDAALSWLCKTLSSALADTETVQKNLNKRHPDFAEFAVRIGRAVGREKEVVRALHIAEADKSRFNMENSNLGQALLDVLRDRPFTGTAKELLAILAEHDASFENQYWTPKRVASRLRQLWPHIKSVCGKAELLAGHEKTYVLEA